MYELYVCALLFEIIPNKQSFANETQDPMTLLFFYRNKHMMCDFGTGNNNKLNWVLEDKQELIDIIETIYKGAKKGRGLVVSPKGEWNVLEPGGKWLMGYRLLYQVPLLSTRGLLLVSVAAGRLRCDLDIEMKKC